MAKVTKKYGDLLGLVQVLNMVLGSKEFKKDNTKGAKKLQKIGEKMKVHIDAYNEKLEEIRLDKANVDKNGSLLLDDKGGYQYTKEGIKELNKQIKALMEETFEFYQFTFSHDGLEKFQFLEGWVEGLEFPEEDEDDLEDKIEEEKAEAIPL